MDPKYAARSVGEARWLAAQILDGAHRTFCGTGSSLSIDTVVARRAADMGVPVRYEYPTAEEAFGLFSGFGHDVELDYLRWTLDRSVHPPGACMAAARAWERGSLTESPRRSGRDPTTPRRTWHHCPAD